MSKTQQSREERIIRTLGAIFFVVVILIAFVTLQPPADLIVAFLGILGLMNNRSHRLKRTASIRQQRETISQPSALPDDNIADKVDMRMRFRWFWGV